MYVDLQMYTNGPSDVDPQAYFEGWLCEKANSSKNQWNAGNDGRYCSKDYDALFAKFKSELDLAKRAELAIQLNDQLIKDNAIIPLINRFTPNGKAKNLEGPTFNTFDPSVLWNIQDWKRTS
jgi:peptide/nickel transport system substrate-binding protein